MASDRDPLLNRSSADEDDSECNEKIPLLPGLDIEKASAAFEPATIEEESQLAKGDGGSDSAETSEDEDEYAAKLKHPLWDNIIVAFRKTFSRAEWMLIAAGLLSSIIVSIVDPIIYLVVGKIVSTLLKHQTITDGQFSNAGEALFGSLPQVSTGGASTTGAPIQSALFGNISRGNSSLNGTGPGGETLFDQALVLIELGAALGVGVLILNLIERLCFGYAAVRQQRRLMLYSVRKLIDMDISWMETRAGRRGPASLLSQTQKNSDIVYSTVSSSIPMVLNLVTSTGVAFGMALWLKWDLALLLLLFIPFIFLLERWYMKAYIKLRLKETHALLRSITVIHEAFLMFSTVISFNGQSTTIKRYMDALAGAMKASIQRSLVVGFADGGLDFLYSLIYIFGMWYGAVTFDPKTQEPGDLLATVMIMNHVCSTASSFRDLIDSLVQAIASIEELREIWDATPEIECPNGIKIDKIEGSIVLQDVFFSYPTRRKVPVLNGINLVIEPGKSVAVVGDSGSGKSTLVAMVMRFYGTTDGELLINSMSARGIDIATLRARIGYVSQEPILFNTSIKENVLMGNPDATDAELTNALRDANALEFVKKLPKGWNTNVGESGIQLSGGQKQRVAIARALIRQPDLLVFDEATSALDSHNEQAVQKAIENATRQCSTLIIAHRLSTVARCDTIVVMKEGKIIESGSPDQLIEQRGVFHSMLDTQRIADVSQTDTDAPQKLADPTSGPDAYDALRAYVTSDGGGYQKSRKHGGKQAARRRRRHKRIYYGAVTDVEFDTEYKDDDYRVAHRLQRAHSLRRKHARRNTYDHLGSTITLASMPLQAEEMGSSKSLSGDALEGTFKEPPKAKWKIGETHKRNWWPIFRILLSTSPLRIVLCFFSAMPRAVGLLAWAVVLALQLQAMALEPDQMIHTQLMIALYWVAISVVKILVEMLNHWIFQDLANVSTIRLREELVTSFFRHGCGWFEGDGEGKDSSTLTIRLGTDVGMLRMAVNDEFMQLGTNIWCCLCAVIFSLVLNWRLAIASLSLYSVFVITMLLDGRYHRLRTEEVRPVNERNAKIMTDGLTHVRTTKAYGLAQYFFDQYVANFDIIQKMRIKMMWVSSLVFAIRAAFMYLYFSSNLFIGSTLIDDGLADVRQIWAFHLYPRSITLLTEIACNRMLATFTALNELFDCMLAADRLGKLYTAPVEYDQMSTAGVKPIISGFIRLKSVTVRYPTRPQVCALKRCDLLVDGCKETAIVGPSGGGKSTVIKLLNRLYEFDTGTVTVDGINIRDINLAHLRQSIVPVNQEPQLFAISLHENIVYGLDEELATRENAVRAAKMANIHDFIVGLPKGYETYAGKLGGSLSGGQKQRIALARAFARRPRVLLLDEATSALDSANEQMIVNSVAEAMKGSTVVTVAHRLSTVQHADRINVLMDGAVTESGTHQQLMKAQRMYHDMCRRQMDFT